MKLYKTFSLSVISLLVVLSACSSSTTPLSPPWSSAPGMLTARSELASTIYKNNIYVAGGINFSGSSDKFEVFDTERRIWTQLPPLPVSLNHIGMANAGGKIYVSGGFLNMRQTEYSNVLYEFDTEKNTWSKTADMPANRAAHFMIERNKILYLIGGRNVRNVWSYDIENDKWDTDALSALPEKRDHISVVKDEHNLYVVGGRIGGTVKKDCWRLKFKSNEWEFMTELPSPRGGQTAILANGKIRIIGGEDLTKGETYRTHNVYDLAKGTWSTGEELPTARHGLTSQIFGDKWYIIGGGEKAGMQTIISASNAVEVYSIEDKTRKID